MSQTDYGASESVGASVCFQHNVCTICSSPDAKTTSKLTFMTADMCGNFSLRGGHPPGTTVKCGSRDCVQSWKHNLCEQQHRPPYQGGGCIGVGGRAVLIGDMQRSEL